ncbi:protein NO VEIN domain-containing protein [Bremerella sp. T1]|uniref:DUF3883 domain-containing protein n=1 Tax=Bremerella sp. TYQ1 TaxID=3119568 RepID=UPI001CCF7234|nr:DUF3883 domain-containing protein [Bremerella volcania]UBM33726.1 DUF3883 domain-containing protein [Bremerella volcania]
MPQNWSEIEVQLIVEDYFEMLQSDLLDQPYSKAEHRRSLSPQLDERSSSSIEFKHQNISAVMVELGLPYIQGYKPRGNFQSLLADGVRNYLDVHPDLLDRLADGPVVSPDRVPKMKPMSFNSVQETPPKRIFSPSESSRPWNTRKPRCRDFAAHDAANRRLGQCGEEWVVDIERQRLISLGRDDLANRVEWVAQSIGDGLGFDVLSFDAVDDSERLIEVKTTGLGKYFPFYVTRNELRCSEDVEKQFHLYRVFDFGRTPRLFVLQGSLRIACQLEAVQYMAAI